MDYPQVEDAGVNGGAFWLARPDGMGRDQIYGGSYEFDGLQNLTTQCMARGVFGPNIGQVDADGYLHAYRVNGHIVDNVNSVDAKYATTRQGVASIILSCTRALYGSNHVGMTAGTVPVPDFDRHLPANWQNFTLTPVRLFRKATEYDLFGRDGLVGMTKAKSSSEKKLIGPMKINRKYNNCLINALVHKVCYFREDNGCLRDNVSDIVDGVVKLRELVWNYGDPGFIDTKQNINSISSGENKYYPVKKYDTVTKKYVTKGLLKLLMEFLETNDYTKSNGNGDHFFINQDLMTKLAEYCCINISISAPSGAGKHFVTDIPDAKYNFRFQMVSHQHVVLLGGNVCPGFTFKLEGPADNRKLICHPSSCSKYPVNEKQKQLIKPAVKFVDDAYFEKLMTGTTGDADLDDSVKSFFKHDYHVLHSDREDQCPEDVHDYKYGAIELTVPGDGTVYRHHCWEAFERYYGVADGENEPLTRVPSDFKRNNINKLLKVCNYTKVDYRTQPEAFISLAYSRWRIPHASEASDFCDEYTEIDVRRNYGADYCHQYCKVLPIRFKHGYPANGNFETYYAPGHQYHIIPDTEEFGCFGRLIGNNSKHPDHIGCSDIEFSFKPGTWGVFCVVELDFTYVREPARSNWCKWLGFEPGRWRMCDTDQVKFIHTPIMHLFQEYGVFWRAVWWTGTRTAVMQLYPDLPARTDENENYTNVTMNHKNERGLSDADLKRQTESRLHNRALSLVKYRTIKNQNILSGTALTQDLLDSGHYIVMPGKFEAAFKPRRERNFVCPTEESAEMLAKFFSGDGDNPMRTKRPDSYHGIPNPELNKYCSEFQGRHIVYEKFSDFCPNVLHERDFDGTKVNVCSITDFNLEDAKGYPFMVAQLGYAMMPVLMFMAECPADEIVGLSLDAVKLKSPVYKVKKILQKTEEAFGPGLKIYARSERAVCKEGQWKFPVSVEVSDPVQDPDGYNKTRLRFEDNIKQIKGLNAPCNAFKTCEKLRIPLKSNVVGIYSHEINNDTVLNFVTGPAGTGKSSRYLQRREFNRKTYLPDMSKVGFCTHTNKLAQEMKAKWGKGLQVCGTTYFVAGKVVGSKDLMPSHDPNRITKDGTLNVDFLKMNTLIVDEVALNSAHTIRRLAKICARHYIRMICLGDFDKTRTYQIPQSEGGSWSGKSPIPSFNFKNNLLDNLIGRELLNCHLENSKNINIVDLDRSCPDYHWKHLTKIHRQRNTDYVEQILDPMRSLQMQNTKVQYQHLFLNSNMVERVSLAKFMDEFNMANDFVTFPLHSGFYYICEELFVKHGFKHITEDEQHKVRVRITRKFEGTDRKLFYGLPDSKKKGPLYLDESWIMTAKSFLSLEATEVMKHGWPYGYQKDSVGQSKKRDINGDFIEEDQDTSPVGYGNNLINPGFCLTPNKLQGVTIGTTPVAGLHGMRPARLYMLKLHESVDPEGEKSMWCYDNKPYVAASRVSEPTQLKIIELTMRESRKLLCYGNPYKTSNHPKYGSLDPKSRMMKIVEATKQNYRRRNAGLEIEPRFNPQMSYESEDDEDINFDLDLNLDVPDVGLPLPMTAEEEQFVDELAYV